MAWSVIRHLALIPTRYSFFCAAMPSRTALQNAPGIVEVSRRSTSRAGGEHQKWPALSLALTDPIPAASSIGGTWQGSRQPMPWPQGSGMTLSRTSCLCTSYSSVSAPPANCSAASCSSRHVIPAVLNPGRIGCLVLCATLDASRCFA